MRRFGGLFPEVVSFHNLVSAGRRAAKGKGHSPEVANFIRNLEPESLALQRELQGGEYRPGRYTTFIITDPKVRQITVAPFRDRVVHHAISGAMEPCFERIFIQNSFACRKGKGNSRALNRAQSFCRRHGFFLKLDVRSFFHSINHNILLTLLLRHFKDRQLLSLLEIVIRHPVPNCKPDCGMPIGNLTSQHLANFYLNALDQFILNELKPGSYLRYMDDFVLFDDNKEKLWRFHHQVEAFLWDGLQLELKEKATLLAPVSQGLPFLGRRVYPNLIRIRRENLRRSLRRWSRRKCDYGEGKLDCAALARSEGALFSHLAQADSLKLRQGIVANSGGNVGQQPRSGNNRVLRGGSWNNNANNCRSANRNNNNPNNTNNNNGFRPVNS